jgi:hypothetical protein
MRRFWVAGGVLIAAGVLVGCDGGGESAVVTPEESKAAVDATKKWQEGHSKPATPTGGSSSAADVLKKKQRRH